MGERKSIPGGFLFKIIIMIINELSNCRKLLNTKARSVKVSANKTPHGRRKFYLECGFDGFLCCERPKVG